MQQKETSTEVYDIFHMLTDAKFSLQKQEKIHLWEKLLSTSAAKLR